MSPRIVITAVAAATALASAGPAAAQKRLVDPSGAFAYVVGDDWVTDEDGNGFAVKCDSEDCGEAGAWCEAGVSGELPEAAVQDFLKGSPRDVDAKVLSSAGPDTKFVATTPVSRRSVGGKDGFYGEYDLQVKGEVTLKTVVLHTYNKRRLVIVNCVSDAMRLPVIRAIVEKSELPS